MPVLSQADSFDALHHSARDAIDFVHPEFEMNKDFAGAGQALVSGVAFKLKNQ
jgi:hypothetical protein